MDLMLFAVASFITVATPGPTTLMLIARASRVGVRGCGPTIVAIAAADVILIAAAVFGSIATSQSHEVLWAALRAAAAGYLFYCAFRNLRRHYGGGSRAAAVDTRRAGELGLSAFTAHVSNAKAALFFAALIPAFVVPTNSQADLFRQIALLCGLHLAVCAPTLAAFAKIGSLVGSLPIGPSFTRAMESLTGLVLLALGLGLLAQLSGI